MDKKMIMKHAAGVLLFLVIASVFFILIPKEAFADPETTDISSGKIWLSQKTFVYDGQSKSPDVTVVVDGETIDSWKYDVRYQNNTRAGTAKVTVTADPYYGYTGSLSRTFTIKKRQIYKSRLKLKKTDFVYNGKIKIISGTYYYDDGRTKYMKAGRDIRIWTAKKLRQVGRYKITVRGMGSFKGKLKYTVIIRPKNPTGVKLVKRGKSSFRVEWNKVKGADGYSASYWSAKKNKYISRILNKRRYFDVPVNQDYSGDVLVYAYERVSGKKIKSTGKYYYNGVKPVTKPKFGLKTEGRTFTVTMRRDGYYEMWTATDKKFNENFKPFTFYRKKGGEFTITGASYGEFYRYIKIRHYVPVSGGGKLYGPWSKIRRAYWY